jgi:hypothetical protein
MVLQGEGVALRGGIQRGQVLWQAMVRDNGYALRVARITPTYGWVFRVWNRAHDWRASGSGVCTPVDPLQDNQSAKVQKALSTFLDMANVGLASNWCAADMLYDQPSGCWLAVDVTLAWNLSRNLVGGNYDAPVINLHTGLPHPKGYRGRDQFECLLDYLEGHGL